MSKNRKLTDFFKPFGSGRPKRPLSIDGDETSTTISHSQRTSRSAAPSIATQTEGTTQEHPAAVAAPGSVKKHHVQKATTSFAEKRGHVFETHIGREESFSLRADSLRDSCCIPSRTASLTEQRVMRNGQVVVIRSSDDEDLSSHSSLDDLDGLLITRKLTAESSTLNAVDDVVPNHSHIASHASAPSESRRLRCHGHSSLTSPLPVIPRYKFSLDSLVEQSEKDTASEADVAQARLQFQASESAFAEQRGLGQQGFSIASTFVGSEQVNECLLESVTSGSGEGAPLHKVLHAMKRTEALHRAKSWSFFRDGYPCSNGKPPPFAEQAITAGSWQGLLSGW